MAGSPANGAEILQVALAAGKNAGEAPQLLGFPFSIRLKKFMILLTVYSRDG
jgi:hypothetical protein